MTGAVFGLSPNCKSPEPSEPARCRYFLEEQPGAEPLLRALLVETARTSKDAIAVITGPEGGWTDRERALAAAAGWKAVSLGQNVLRAETAAMAAVAVISQAWHNLS